jgi:hypothetical protein
MSTLELINSLPIPSDTDTLCVEAIIENEFYVSRNNNGYSGLMIKLDSTNSSFLTYSSESLDIFVRDECKIESEKETYSVSALIIQPKIEHMEVVVASFADMIVKYNFNKKENLNLLNDYLSKLINLFTYKTDDKFPLNSAIGLWGELYLILQFPNTINFWKGSQGTTFDFQDKNISLEVKSSIKGKNFKIQSKQLLGGKNQSFLFAVNPELDYDSGCSVADLVEEINKNIPIEKVFEFMTGLSLRGFTMGNTISNLNKPFKLSSKEPIVIDLLSIESELMNSIVSISQCVEQGFISKVDLTINYSQLKLLENITYADFSKELRRF